MESLDDKLQIIKDSILSVVPAKQIYLFGSYAYGIPNEKSDIDIMIILPDRYKDDIGLILYPKISKQILENKIFFVDLVFSWDSKFNGYRKDCCFETTIREKGKMLYEHD